MSVTLQLFPVPDGYYVLLSLQLNYYYSYHSNYQRFLFFVSSFPCIYYGNVNLNHTVCVHQCNPKCDCINHGVDSLPFSEIFQLDCQLQVCVYHKCCFLLIYLKWHILFHECYFLNLVFLLMFQKFTIFVEVHRQSPPSYLLHYLLRFHHVVISF